MSRLEQLRKVVHELHDAPFLQPPECVKVLAAWAEQDCDCDRPKEDYENPDVALRWYAGQLLALLQPTDSFTTVRNRVTLIRLWPALEAQCTSKS